MAGSSTHFGDAIGLSIQLFENSESENRVLIVLTDGNDTGSKVPPIEAAKVAKAYVNLGVVFLAGQQLNDAQYANEQALRIYEITEGTRSKAMTATAPDFSAMACRASAL